MSWYGYDVLPIELYIRHTSSDPKLKKSKYRGIIMWYLVGLSMLSKAYCEERRSLWYNNGRTKSKLSMASRGFTIDTRWNLITNTMSLPSTISNGFHSYILWRILTHTKKLFTRLQVEHWQRSCGYPYNDVPINRSLQSKIKWYQSKDKLFEWHLQWNSLYGARLDSIVERISDEEIKMAKTRN
jgi:hypothetical protein